MIDFEGHFKRLQDALGVRNTLGKYCVDVIDEGLWWNVMYQLNKASIKVADELQEETGKPYPKEFHVKGAVKSVEELNALTGETYDLLYQDSNGRLIARKNQKYSKAPPTRLLALNLILSYWLGWLDAKGGHALDTEPVAAWRRIKEVYDKGKQDASKPEAIATSEATS